MMHERRNWMVAEVAAIEELAAKLTQYTWTSCSGWKLRGSKLIYLNDSTGGDGAQEYGAVIAETGEQVESVTFGWMTEERALKTLRAYEDQAPAERCGRVDPSRYNTATHGETCHLVRLKALHPSRRRLTPLNHRPVPSPAHLSKEDAMVRLRKLHKARITLEDGAVVEVERIGRGRYTTAWKNGTSVYLQTSTKDSSKEILAFLRGRKHIPKCEDLGPMSSDHRLYRMPFYRKVTAKGTPEASRQLQTLSELRNRAQTIAADRQGGWDRWDAYDLNGVFDELLDNEEHGLPESLVDACHSLTYQAANYGALHRRVLQAQRRGRRARRVDLARSAEARLPTGSVDAEVEALLAAEAEEAGDVVR